MICDKRHEMLTNSFTHNQKFTTKSSFHLHNISPTIDHERQMMSGLHAKPSRIHWQTASSTSAFGKEFGNPIDIDKE